MSAVKHITVIDNTVFYCPYVPIARIDMSFTFENIDYKSRWNNAKECLSKRSCENEK